LSLLAVDYSLVIRRSDIQQVNWTCIGGLGQRRFKIKYSGTDIVNNLLLSLVDLSVAAGEQILAIYESEEFGIETKADDSPLTRADMASHRVLVEGLSSLTPDIPILSEEGELPSFEMRRQWSRYWLIDPLDGTKEFISRNGEFTVNIALIEDGVPTIGVVHVPVRSETYLGSQQEGGQAAVIREGVRQDIHTRRIEADELILVASRRHGGDALMGLMAKLEQQFSQVHTRNMGSSLKLCLVAEGQADFYPRLAPTSEWDTAAAQAVVEAAGGRVTDTQLNPLRYNTKDNILNPNFYVLGDADYAWSSILD